jgi:hypothetical protein
MSQRRASATSGKRPQMRFCVVSQLSRPRQIDPRPERFARGLNPRGFGVLAFEYRGFGQSDFSSVDALPHCQVPLHVIAFSEDLQTPPALGKLVADLAPRGRFHLLTGLGRGSLFGHRPDVVNDCMRGILNASNGPVQAPDGRAQDP